MSDLIGGDLLNSQLSDDLIAVQNSTGKLFLYPGTGSGGLGARKEIGTGAGRHPHRPPRPYPYDIVKA